MNTLQELKFDDILNLWDEHQKLPELAGMKAGFLLFYSSVWNGISADPRSFFVPIDDHGFHRGDGVFEALRAVSGRPYLMKEHLARLGRSAAAIGLSLPKSTEEIAGIIEQMAKKTGEADQILRVFVTRGPGGFGVNPHDSPSSRLYIVATKFKPAPREVWEKGVRLGLTRVSVKPAPFAGIKSLNYLPNVLMKKEAIDAGFDFAVGFDGEGYLTEGATENLAILNREGELVHPRLISILDGCTMKRVFDLAERANLVPVRREQSLKEQDLFEAKEIYLIGTALDVTPVGYFVDREKPVGPLAGKLKALLTEDQLS